MATKISWSPLTTLRHAADDDPVLAAVVVHLQAEATAGLDFDALDLEARAFLEHGVGTPRACNGTVQLVGVVILFLELGNDLLDVLRLVWMSNQQGIRGTDDHQVVETHGGNQAVLALDEGVLAVHEYGFADRAVVVGIRRDEAADGIPGTDVAPAEVGGNHGYSGGTLHDGVVNGNVRHFGEGFGRDFEHRFMAGAISDIAAQQASEALSTSGACRASSSSTAPALKQNMPEFHRKLPAPDTPGPSRAKAFRRNA